MSSGNFTADELAVAETDILVGRPVGSCAEGDHGRAVDAGFLS
ncbi:MULTISPECIES: hypothetical protein [Mesorhizobium]|nr:MULTISPECIES: hypothetical protein [Mesorhizobium]